MVGEIPKHSPWFVAFRKLVAIQVYMNTPAIRVEEDAVGTRSILVNASMARRRTGQSNFQISGLTRSYMPLFIAALAFLKDACAFANFVLGKPPEQRI